MLLVFFLCTYIGRSPALSDEHSEFQWIDTRGDRPPEISEFYWEHTLRALAISPETSEKYTKPGVIDYPLNTGEADRRRLAILADVYDKETTRFIEKHLPDRGRILDVGAGHGSVARWMAEQRPLATVIGLDKSDEQVEAAKAANRSLGLANLLFRSGDLCNLAGNPVLSEPFDLITCRFILMHLPNREQIIDTLLGLLSKTGRLVIQEPTLDSPFTLPPLHAFIRANQAIQAYGKRIGLDYDCIRDVWRTACKPGIHIREVCFSQPTVWSRKHKEMIRLSFDQFRPKLVAMRLLAPMEADEIAQGLAREYMDERIISGGLRTIQIALSPWPPGRKALDTPESVT
ncbi:hypothetical protein ASB57_17335 [Bordetella sp. N]|nr:hypothetical protein ASB57_17335 [Bordetella sp. N]